MGFPSFVRIVEVGPRDGLQNEATLLPVSVKIELIERLADAGLPAIEAGSFVSPKWTPQMAGTAEVFAGLRRKPGVVYSALVPNEKGLAGALAAKVDEFAIFTAASEAFCRKNINCTIAESLERFAPVAEAAQATGVRLRGYVSCALGCPYQGEVAPAEVARVAEALIAMGCHEVSIADTIGVGTPTKALAMLDRVLERVPVEKIALHFHDTYGQALANIHACLPRGVSVLDAAVAGLGGCPYARGASGNVATEDLVYMLDGMGIATGVDLDALIGASHFISAALGRAPQSKLAACGTRRR